MRGSCEWVGKFVILHHLWHKRRGCASHLGNQLSQGAFMSRRASAESNIREVLLETYAANDRMNQLLLEHLDARAWRAKPPGLNRLQGRTIAAIFAHMHNNRLVWLKWSAPHRRCPATLDPARCTVRQS